MKRCGNCESDISDRAPQARYCDEPTCRRERMLAHGRTSYNRHRADIRERQNAVHRARVAAKPPKVRLCRHCGKDISHRGGRAQWCDMSCREKARHAANPDRSRDKAAAWRAVNPERYRENLNRWRKANPERYHEQIRRAQNNRRAWKLEAPGEGISGRSWHRLLIRHDGRCAYCKQPPPDGERLTMEHVVPLSRGGSHSEGNILPACGTCNTTKNDKLLIEWRAGRRISRKRRASTSPLMSI
jgi:HNH endonuclease